MNVEKNKLKSPAYLGVGDFVSVKMNTGEIYTGILDCEVTKFCSKISLKQVTVYMENDTNTYPDEEIVTLDVEQIRVIN